VIDASLASTDRGIWAIKWSFVILAITSAIQLAVVYFTGSVALLADTIHNIGDATTAIPLWFAFVLARRKPSRTFNYGSTPARSQACWQLRSPASLDLSAMKPSPCSAFASAAQ